MDAVNVPSANVWTMVVANRCGADVPTAVIATATLCSVAAPVRVPPASLRLHVQAGGGSHKHNTGRCDVADVAIFSPHYLRLSVRSDPQDCQH